LSSPPTPDAKTQNNKTKTKKQVKRAIEKGNVEGAKIYAQNAIRKKHEQLNFLRLASRLDAVVSRLEAQARMQMVNRSMAGITKSLERALATNNLEQIAATMQQFERQFDNLEVQTAVVDGVMAQQAAASTPEDEVSALMQQVAEEHGLELQVGLPGAASTSAAPAMAQGAGAAEEQDPLSRRLAELRGR
jgi:charged multivesicular body protein 1